MSGKFIFLFLYPLLSLTVCTARLCAQEYSWRYYSVRDGLPQTQVYSIYQDKKGYVWIGTKGGVSRFDGIEFRNFKFDDGLEDEFIKEIREDSHGDIYIISKNHIKYYNRGVFSLFVVEEPTTTSINCVPDRDNNLIVIKSNLIEIFSIDRKPASIPILDDFIKKYQGTFREIYKNDQSGNIYFMVRDGSIFWWDGQQLHALSTGHKSLYPEMGMDGNLYAHDQDSLYIFDGVVFSPILSIPGMVVRKVVSRREIYLTNVDNFNWLYLYDGEKITRFHQRFNVIIQVMKDDEDNLWIGTESGLWLLQNKGFQNFFYDIYDNFYTWSVAEDRNGNMLFGSFLHGLKKYDGKVFSTIPIDKFFDPGGWQYFYSGSCLDEFGNILFSTYSGILKYDGQKLSWFYKGNSGSVLFIYPDSLTGHYLALTAYDGLIEIDKNGTLVKKENRLPMENTGLETNVLRDKYGRIWLSGKQGISIKDNDSWRNLPDESDNIPIGAISMIKDHRGNLWFGSNDGLYFYDYAKLRKVAGRLFDHQVGVLNLTDDNELFIGSIKGICLLNLEEFYNSGQEKLRYFDESNGFMGTECKHNSSFKDSNGNIWVCTSDRVVKTIPSELRVNSSPPRVYVQSISASSSRVHDEPVFEVNNMEAVYTINRQFEDIRFQYHAISHAAPKGVQYRTMLEGYDADWSLSTAERYRNYTNLKPGKYTFKVMAANVDGVWNEQPASLAVELLPAWHELATVRYTGLILMIALATFLGFIYSEHLRKRKLAATENAREMARLQLNALKKLIDPHFTFNALNSIAAMVYREQRDEAYGYFAKFSRLIRVGFETSEEVIRTIGEEIEFVKCYLDLEKLRFKDRFDYRIRLGEKVNEHWKIPKMIIQIYVENAIKHGFVGIESGGLVEVDLDVIDDQLRIMIRDNGIGRNSNNHQKSDSLGKGTKIIANYLKLINDYNENKIRWETRDIVHADGSTGGVEVIFLIPVQLKFE